VDAIIPFLETDQADLWTRRAMKFVETVTVELGLQLSYALGSGSFGVFPAYASPIYTPIRLTDASEGVAPVFQASLCVERSSETGVCCGAATRVDPWFDTPSGMYAAHAIQECLPRFEEIADATLASVVLHSGLGVPLQQTAAVSASRDVGSDNLAEILRELVGAAQVNLADLSMLGLEYESGSPRLESSSELAWREETFFDRVTGSSLGMSLAREAQEAAQLLASRRGSAYGETADEGTAGLLYLISALGKVSYIEQVLDRMESEKGVRYIPHAVRLQDDGREIFDVVEPISDLQDLASILLGLAELRRGIAGSLESAVRDVGAEPVALTERIDALIGTALTILLERHYDPTQAIYVRRAWIGPDGWEQDGVPDPAVLGLLANSLLAVSETVSPNVPLYGDSREAITRVAEFIQLQMELESPSISLTNLNSVAGAILTLAASGEQTAVQMAQELFERMTREIVALTQIETPCGTSEWVYTYAGSDGSCFTAWDVGLVTASLSRLADVVDAPEQILHWRDRFVAFLLEDSGLSMAYGIWPACKSRAVEGALFAPVIARESCAGIGP